MQNVKNKFNRRAFRKPQFILAVVFFGKKYFKGFKVNAPDLRLPSYNKQISNNKKTKMNKSILKTIVAGILLGSAAFYMPFFLIRGFLFILIIGAILRLFVRPRFGKRFSGRGFQMVFADKIRTMSDEEYAGFKQGSGGHCGRSNPHQEGVTKTK